METQNLIVGGGTAGLLAAHVAKKMGWDFVGLERGNKLGGKLGLLHPMLQSEESASFMRSFFPMVKWRPLQEGTSADSSESLNERISEMPAEEFSTVVSKAVIEHFLMSKNVVSLNLENRIVTCQDGSQFEFKNLFWCAPLRTLEKSLEKKNQKLPALLRKIKAPIAGFLFQHERLKEDKTPSSRFDFRFKDLKLQALETRTETTSQWMVLVTDEDTAENNEEIAKCVRTFKRELAKFLNTNESFRNERLVFHTSLSVPQAAPVENLAIIPQVYYVGSEIIVGDSAKARLPELDRIIDNCLYIQQSLAAH